MAREVVVIGAGVVGMCAALELAADGHRVTVLDPAEPGSGTSSGNAGVIATELSLPIVTPGVLGRLPRMLLDPDGPLVIRPAYLPAISGWLVRLALATRPARFAATTQALGALLDLARDAFHALARRAGAEDLVIARGRLVVYSDDAALRASAPLCAEWARRGIRHRTLAAAAARELEPVLSPAFAHAHYLEDGAHVASPRRFVQRIARALVERGGRIVRQAARELRGAPGRREVVTDEAIHRADVAVVAAGAWSKRFGADLGARVPLDTERGYHVMFPAMTPSLQRPVLWADRYLHLVPMTEGVRMTTGVELAGLHAPPDFRRVRRLAQRARELVPALAGSPTSEWLGFRPSLPDSLPVLGTVPGHGDVILCFGHHHLGLTLGPISGRIVADLVSGRDPPLSLAPYAPRRAYC